MKSHDLPTLQRLLEEAPPQLEAAGLQPTADQIELYAYHLPNATLSNLMVRDIVITIKPQLVSDCTHSLRLILNMTANF